MLFQGRPTGTKKIPAKGTPWTAKEAERQLVEPSKRDKHDPANTSHACSTPNRLSANHYSPVINASELVSTEDEPGHQALCEREQRLFLSAIRGEIDLTEHHEAAINSLSIVFAADESIRSGEVVRL